MYVLATALSIPGALILTLAAGANFTIVGTATIATVTTAIYMVRKSSATACTITRLIAAAY